MRDPTPIAMVEPTIKTTKKMAIHCSVSIHGGSLCRKLDLSLAGDTLNSRQTKPPIMSSRSAMPTFELVGLFAVVYLLQMLSAVTGLVSELFVLQPPIQDDPWTVVTSVFAHADIGHLVSNSVALLLIGIPVAMFTTRVRFHSFFVGAGALAGVAQIVLSGVFSVVPVVGFTASPGVVGASGGVFALLGYLLASNRVATTLGSALRLPNWLTYAVFFLLAGMLTLVTASPGAALIAHFTGLIVGLAAGRAHLLDPMRW
ncbi:rhomboid family intramembrane serine protease [Halovenus salina]